VAHHHQVGLEARDEHQEQDTDLREIADEIQERYARGSGWGRKHRPLQHVQQRRAEQESYEDFPEDRRLVQPAGERSSGFRRGDD